MHPFVETVMKLPCWEESRRYTQIQPPQNNGEVMYVVIASILAHGDGDPKLDNKMRLFAAQYNMSFTRQRELFEMASGWNAEKTIRQCGVAAFIEAFIDTCLYDHQLQPVEFWLLHYFSKRFAARPGRTDAVTKEQALAQSRSNKERIRKQFASLKYRAIVFFDRPVVATVVTILIVLNAALFGMLTNDWVAANWGRWLNGLDTVFLTIFTVEIACRLFAFRREYFKEPLNALDFVIILVSWAPFPGSTLASAFRAFRVFRALLLVNRFSKLKLIMKSLEASLPNIGWLSVLLIVFFYVFAVLTTNLFGKECAMFRSIPASLLSLFQLMTLEGWPDLMQAVMVPYPWAWLVFIPFILISSYIFLNLVVGIIVSTMQEMYQNATAETRREIDEIKDVKIELQALTERLEALSRRVAPDAPDAAAPDGDCRTKSRLFHRQRRGDERHD